MVVSVQSKTRYRMSNDSFQRKSIVVRPLKEILFGVRVGDQQCSVSGEFRPKRGPFVTRQPKRIGRNFWIRPSKHLKRYISYNLLQGHGRMSREILGSGSPQLFTPKTYEIHSS